MIINIISGQQRLSHKAMRGGWPELAGIVVGHLKKL